MNKIEIEDSAWFWWSKIWYFLSKVFIFYHFKKSLDWYKKSIFSKNTFFYTQQKPFSFSLFLILFFLFPFFFFFHFSFSFYYKLSERNSYITVYDGHGHFDYDWTHHSSSHVKKGCHDTNILRQNYPSIIPTQQSLDHSMKQLQQSSDTKLSAVVFSNHKEVY